MSSDLANVSFGTPLQNLSLAVGTKSPRTWVNSVQCTNAACEGHAKRKYNASRSSTHSRDGHAFSAQTEEWGKVSGYTSSDHVKLGELFIKNQNFGEVDQASWEFGFGWFDGMLGLGLPNSSQISILQNLVDRGLLDRPLFSLYLANGDMTTGSELLLGGVDDDLFTKPLYELQVRDEATEWELQLDTLQFGDDVFEPDGAIPAVIDSASSLIWVPSNIHAYM